MKWTIILMLLGWTYHYDTDGSSSGSTYDTGSGWEYNYDASGEYEGSSYGY